MRRITARSATLTAIFLAGALALGGCSAASGSYGDGSGGDSAPEMPAESDAQYDEETGGNEGELDGGGVSSDDAVQRDIITIGEIVVTAEAPLDAAEEAADIVEAAGGRVDARTEHAPADGDAGRATLVLRIPAKSLTTTLDKLKGLGRADEVDVHSSDVTVEHQDLTARISALTASIASLENLMSKATKIEDLIMLEGAISDRQAQLDSLQAQQRGLEDQIAMSTITLTLRSEQAAPDVVPADFWTGLAAGWNAFVGFWAGLLVVLGVLAPWLVTAGIVTFVVVFLVRWNRKRAASRPQPPAPPAPPAPILPPPTAG